MNPHVAAVSVATLDVEVLIEEPAWTEAVPDAAEQCRAAAAASFAYAVAAGRTARQSAEACLLLADDARVRALNRDFRGRDEATDVLSFASVEPDVLAAVGADGPPPLLGDVVVAFQTAAADAAEQNKPLANHLRHLVIHGILHLLGYDHQSDADAAEMEGLEIRILANLGVGDPYASLGEQ